MKKAGLLRDPVNSQFCTQTQKIYGYRHFFAHKLTF
jgi:hypothetical protein